MKCYTDSWMWIIAKDIEDLRAILIEMYDTDDDLDTFKPANLKEMFSLSIFLNEGSKDTFTIPNDAEVSTETDWMITYTAPLGSWVSCNERGMLSQAIT